MIAAPDGSGEWVLVNGYDGITRCLLASDGSEVWTYKTDDYINGTPAVIDGRFVAFGGCDKVIHVLKLADGKPWSTRSSPTPRSPTRSPPPAPRFTAATTPTR